MKFLEIYVMILYLLGWAYKRLLVPRWCIDGYGSGSPPDGEGPEIEL